jgi:hypothetical protein
MASFYEEQKRAFKEIDEKLLICMNEKIDVDLDILVYDFLNVYAIGEKKIRDRIDHFLKINGKMLKNGKIKFNEK